MNYFNKLSLIGVLLSAASAQGAMHLDCKYQTSRGAIQTLTFDSVESGPAARSGRQFLSVNGQAPIEFEVLIVPTHVGTVSTYRYRNPFFVSDITLRIEHSFAEQPQITGTWVVDYPPAIEFSCQNPESF